MYTPTYLGEIPLDEETLAHYGVKGMKWGRRKVRAVKGKLKGLRTKLRWLKINPHESARKTRTTLERHLPDARTNEERLAIRTSIENAYARETGDKKFRQSTSGGKIRTRWRDGSITVNDRPEAEIAADIRTYKRKYKR